jgi:hypothetical protein
MTALSNDPLYPPRFGVFLQFVWPENHEAKPSAPSWPSSVLSPAVPLAFEGRAEPPLLGTERHSAESESSLTPERDPSRGPSPEPTRKPREPSPEPTREPSPERVPESAWDEPAPQKPEPTQTPGESSAAALAALADLAKSTESTPPIAAALSGSAPLALELPLEPPRRDQRELQILNLTFGDLLRRKDAW